MHFSVYLKPVNNEADEMDLAVCAFIGDMPKAARKNWQDECYVTETDGEQGP